MDFDTGKNTANAYFTPGAAVPRQPKRSAFSLQLFQPGVSYCLPASALSRLSGL
jgi:hypothetical protein